MQATLPAQVTKKRKTTDTPVEEPVVAEASQQAAWLTDSETNQYQVLGETKATAKNEKRLTLNAYRGAKQVNLRAWYLDKQGVRKPGKSGITLNLAQFKQLLDNQAAILKHLEN
jgi:hypothetical protein